MSFQSKKRKKEKSSWIRAGAEAHREGLAGAVCPWWMRDRGLLLGVAWPVQTTRGAQWRSVNTQPLLRRPNQSGTDIHRPATVINHSELSKNGTSHLGGSSRRWSRNAALRDVWMSHPLFTSEAVLHTVACFFGTCLFWVQCWVWVFPLSRRCGHCLLVWKCSLGIAGRCNIHSKWKWTRGTEESKGWGQFTKSPKKTQYSYQLHASTCATKSNYLENCLYKMFVLLQREAARRFPNQMQIIFKLFGSFALLFRSLQRLHLNPD